MAATSLTQSLKDAIPLSKSRNYFPVRPHPATIWRWGLKGCRGVKLATWMAGGKRVTTLAAIEEFLQHLNSGGVSPHEVNGDEVRRRAKEAGAALEKLGC